MKTTLYKQIKHAMNCKEGAVEFEWTKRDGSLSETNAKVTNNVLDIQPIEPKDIDVYTCTARSGDTSQANSSVAFDNEFNVRRLHNGLSKRPEIIEIYKFGQAKLNQEYSLRCISGQWNKLFLKCVI